MSSIHELVIEDLTAEAFAPFGEILQPHEVASFDVPTKSLHRFPWQADAPVIVQLLSFKPQPFAVNKIERHMHVTETRMHIGGSPAVIVVGEPSSEIPSPQALRAFRLDGQGVMFKLGTWHAVDAYPLGAENSLFLFLSDKATQSELFDNPVESPQRSTLHTIDPARQSILIGTDAPDPSARASRIAGIEISGIVQISEAAARERAKGHKIVDLGVGEPDFPTPDHVVEAAFAAARRGQTRYTANAGSAELRSIVAERHGVAANNVLVSAGAKQTLFNAFMATLDPGDEVLFGAPYWTTYFDAIRFASGRPVVIETSGTGFKITPDALERAITRKTRWLLLNNPGNPSGAVYHADELAALAEVLRRHPHVGIICDEIYREICYVPFASFRTVAPDLADRMLIVDGASKSYAMTGWRIGWGVGPRRLIERMSIVQGQSTSCASSVSQAAAIAALTGPSDYLAERCRSFHARAVFLADRLTATGLFDCPTPEGAFYLFPACTKAIGLRMPDGARIASEDAFFTYLLEAAQVATVPGRIFGSPGHLRMCYAIDRDTLAEACDRITEATGRLVRA